MFNLKNILINKYLYSCVLQWQTYSNVCKYLDRTRFCLKKFKVKKKKKMIKNVFSVFEMIKKYFSLIFWFKNTFNIFFF